MSEKHNPVKQYCPNCSGQAIREGDYIICTTCDAKFKITKTGSATVVKLGEFEQLKSRVGALESLLTPEPEPEPAKLIDTDGDAEEAEEPILPE